MNENIFRNIKELRHDYMVIACFNEINDTRLFADIVRITKKDIALPVDAYIIMINPGSCKPQRPEDRKEFNTVQYQLLFCTLDEASSVKLNEGVLA